MAKYIADVSGVLTEILPINIPSSAAGKYGGTDNPTDTTYTARSSTADANKIIELDANGLINKHFLPYRFITQAGTAASAGYSAILDGTGRWHMSLMPVGIGAEVVIDAATEALTGGAFCNIHAVGIRLAGNTGVSLHAHGFVLSSFALAATATMFGISNINTAVIAARGSTYYLGTAGGIVLAGALPTANSSIVQRLGTAHSGTELLFNNTDFHVRNAT